MVVDFSRRDRGVTFCGMRLSRGRGFFSAGPRAHRRLRRDPGDASCGMRWSRGRGFFSAGPRAHRRLRRDPGDASCGMRWSRGRGFFPGGAAGSPSPSTRPRGCVAPHPLGTPGAVPRITTARRPKRRTILCSIVGIRAGDSGPSILPHRWMCRLFDSAAARSCDPVPTGKRSEPALRHSRPSSTPPLRGAEGCGEPGGRAPPCSPPAAAAPERPPGVLGVGRDRPPGRAEGERSQFDDDSRTKREKRKRPQRNPDGAAKHSEERRATRDERRETSEERRERSSEALRRETRDERRAKRDERRETSARTREARKRELRKHEARKHEVRKRELRKSRKAEQLTT
jgi:hypothetical protein